MEGKLGLKVGELEGKLAVAEAKLQAMLSSPTAVGAHGETLSLEQQLGVRLMVREMPYKQTIRSHKSTPAPIPHQFPLTPWRLGMVFLI